MGIFLFANIWHTDTIVKILCLHHPQSAYSLDLLSVCNSRMPTGTKSIHSPQPFLTCSLVGFSTHTNTHDTQRASIPALRYTFPPTAATSPQDRKSKWTRVICVLVWNRGHNVFCCKAFFFVSPLQALSAHGPYRQAAPGPASSTTPQLSATDDSTGRCGQPSVVLC